MTNDTTKPHIPNYPAYSIDALCPFGGMGGYGFSIHLSPQFREAVSKSEIDQEKANHVIEVYGNEWASKCGMLHYYDPENSGMDRDNRRIPSKEIKASNLIRISWGEWGPEHLSVPGNACGLDIDRDTCFCVYRGGMLLVPHNIDHWGQVNLLLIVFTWFAHSLTLLSDGPPRN